jgi:hypothetical protein
VANIGKDSNNCTAPSSPCATINKAVSLAINGEVIYIATGLYRGYGDEVVFVDRSLTLSGGWSADFNAQTGTSVIDGSDSRTGIVIDSGADVSIENFTIRNASNSGIRNGGSLKLEDVTVVENRALRGGGIYNGQHATLEVNQTTVQDNRANSVGGGLFLSPSGIFTATNSTFIGNTTAGGSGGGIYVEGGSAAMVSESMITQNEAAHGGGGVHARFSTVVLSSTSIIENNAGSWGGGILNNGTLDVSNCTISSNTTDTEGGGFYNLGGGLSLNSSTISNNESGNGGGGIYQQDGNVTLQNTILGDNHSAVSPDCYGAIDSSGYNLIGDTTGCTYTSAIGDLINENPDLGALVGLPLGTLYQPLMASSPAIDAGNPGGCTDHLGTALLADQRGYDRTGVCDIGAYEYASPGYPDIVYAYSGTPQSSPIFIEYNSPLQAAVLDAVGSPVEDSLVNFTASSSGASGTFSDTGTYTATAVTDESGIATSASFTANGETGNHTITAMAGDGIDHALFQLTNTSMYVSPLGDDFYDCLTPATPCATINGAINKASPGETIYVATGIYTTNTGTEVVLIDRTITLSGGWDQGFTTQEGMATIDGDGVRRAVSVLDSIYGPTVAEVKRVIIQNGYATSGGAGLNNYSTLTLTNSKLQWNDGFVAVVSNSGTVTLTNTIISRNTSLIGVNNYSGGSVGLINTSVSGNESGILNQNGTLRLINSLVDTNIGNGIYHGSGVVVITNSTISSNGGHGFTGGSGTMAFNSSSVVGNSATPGGGIYNFSSSAIITLQNTIVAENTGDSGPDCFGEINSLGYNLIGNVSDCSFTQSSGDMVNTDAGLGPLMGSPGYHPLSVNSPAVDAGNPAGCTDGSVLLSTDQRGVPRVGRCDIGAYEYTPPGPAVSISATGGTPQHTRPLTAFEDSLMALVLDNLGNPVDDVAVTFSAPSSGASGVFTDTGFYTTTVQTDEWGMAVAPTFTANEMIGDYEVNATVVGVGTPAVFILGNFAWFVKPDGSDANDCLSPETACGTVAGPLIKSDFFPGDVVLVGTGIYTGNSVEVALLNEDVTLLGGWDAGFTTQTGISTIDGQGVRRGITLEDRVNTTIEHFIVQNGSANYGAGIYFSWYSTLSLKNSVIQDNIASDIGGGIYGEGYTSLTLENCDVISNTAPYAGGVGSYGAQIINNSNVSDNHGGGIYVAWEGLTLNTTTVSQNIANSRCGGGLFNDSGSIFLNNSTITGNSAGAGGGICNKGSMTLNNLLVSENIAGVEGGGILSSEYDSAMTLTNTIVSSNTTGSRGGGIYGGNAVINNSVIKGNTVTDTGYGGGGIYTTGPVTINNSTINDNTVPSYGGGINQGGNILHLNNVTLSNNSAFMGGGFYKWSGTATMNNVTVTGNQATETDGYGGGLYNNVYYGTLTLQNTIVSGNENNNNPECYGTIASAGYNLVGNTTGCDFTASTGDLLDVDPLLGPLQDNGGPTYTHGFPYTSPVINRGNPAGCLDHEGHLLTTDQRGYPRFGICDIGAFEYQGFVTRVYLPCILKNYCQPIYSDNFNDPASGWPVGDFESYQLEYLGGEYRMLINTAGILAGASPGFKASGFVLDIDVRNQTGVFGSYGLLFGISDDWNQFYTFEITPDGYYLIYKYDNGAWTELAFDNSTAIHQGTASNRLRIVRDGPSMMAYANGSLLASLSDSSFIDSRRLGLITSAYDWTPVDARFDNFTVLPLSCIGITSNSEYDSPLYGDGTLGKALESSFVLQNTNR